MFSPSQANFESALDALLLRVEKNFAVYLESKKGGAQVKRRQVSLRLAKAVSILAKATAGYEPFLDSKSKLELKIYTAGITGALRMQQGRLAEAKEAFSFQLNAARGLAEGSPAVEKAVLEEIAEAAAQSVRYCRFHLKEFGAEQISAPAMRDASDLAELIKQINENSGAAGARKVEFFEPVLIDDPAIVAQLNKLDAVKQNLNRGDDPEELLFWESVNVAEEGAALCRKKRADSAGSLERVLSNLEAFFGLEKELLLLKRNIKSFANFQARKEDLRPQESARVIEVILENLRHILDVYTRYNKQSKLFTGLESSFRGKKLCFLVQLFYNAKLYLNSLSLVPLARQCQNEMLAALQTKEASADASKADSELKIAGEVSFTDALTTSLREAPELASKLVVIERQARVALFDEQQSKLAEVSSGLKELKVTTKFDRAVNMNCILDLVLEGKEIRGQEELEFVKIPPVAPLMPSKPIFVDVVGQLVDYPPLEPPTEAKKEESKGGFFSKIWGSK